MPGGVPQFRAGLAERLRLAGERLQAARADRIAAALVREHERITGELESVMVRGLDQMRGPAAARDQQEVLQLEQIARQTLAQIRGLLVRLRGDEQAEPDLNRSVPGLQARVAGVLAADSAFPASPTGPGRWTLWSARQGDWALATLACALAASLAATRHWPAPALLGVGIALPFAWLRRYPLTATALSMAAFIGYSSAARYPDPFTGQPPTGVLIVIPLVTAAVGTRARAVTALVACLGGGLIAVLADPAARFHVLTAPTAAAVAIGSWAAGRVLHQTGQTLAALTDTTRQASPFVRYCTARRVPRRTRHRNHRAQRHDRSR